MCVCVCVCVSVCIHQSLLTDTADHLCRYKSMKQHFQI